MDYFNILFKVINEGPICLFPKGAEGGRANVDKFQEKPQQIRIIWLANATAGSAGQG